MISEDLGIVKTQLMFNEIGSPCDVLKVVTALLRPSDLPAGQVLVKMLAAPINPADLNTIEGTYGIQPELPATPGIEGCGEVVASQDDTFRAGDRVIFLRRSATWASHAVVSASSLFGVPEKIDPLQAAMLKVNPATA